MTDQPNYRALDPPDDKPPEAYTYVERRAALEDRICEAGHSRNLPQTQRELAREFGVSQSQIQKDIQRLREWQADHLGDHARGQLEILRTKAIQHLLDEGKPDKAYYLMKSHYELLLDAGIKESPAETVTVSVEDMDDPGERYVAALEAVHDAEGE